MKPLFRSSELVPEADFSKSHNSSWGSWMMHTLVKKSITLPFILVKNLLLEQTPDLEARYVSLEVVKHLSAAILDAVDDAHDNKVMRFKDFLDFCRSKTTMGEESAARLVLAHLEKTGKATIQHVTRDKPDLLVKIARHKVHAITDTEMALDFLAFQEEILVKDIEALERKKMEILEKVKANLKGNLRTMAKTMLRKKQEVERNIQTRHNSLMNIQKLEAKIHDAESGKGVLEGYKVARDALKKFESGGFTEKTVEEAMDSLAEVRFGT